jgi:hypothetical protein
VTLFNPVVQPVIILTSVILSPGGAFRSLAVINSPFATILTLVVVPTLYSFIENTKLSLANAYFKTDSSEPQLLFYSIPFTLIAFLENTVYKRHVRYLITM